MAEKQKGKQKMLKNYLINDRMPHADESTKEMRWRLEHPYIIVEEICNNWLTIAVFTYLSVCILRKTLWCWLDSVILALAIGFLIFVLCIGIEGRKELTQKITSSVYFVLITRHGKAIDNWDWRDIKYTKNSLYTMIKNQSCRGACYPVSFWLVKLLMKGRMDVCAVKECHYTIDKEGVYELPYTMHALFVADGWAFDTFSCRQIPVDKIYNVYGAKLCKSYTYNEIMGISYGEWKKKEARALKEWADKNECVCTLKKEVE